MWGLYGNENTKGWEVLKTNKTIPEFGGRIQMPVPLGEAALSYHHRVIDYSLLESSLSVSENISENRLGIDARFDWLIGCWMEGSWTHKEKELGVYTNQELFNVGVDYTFGIGSGVYLSLEQLMIAYDEKAFELDDPSSFSLLSFSYPIGIFDNINAIVYYDWKNNNAYNFINYQHQFNDISFYVMAYVNPENYAIPTQDSSIQLFGGKGIQLMLVWNY
jgi:hypothetical protein